MRLDARRVIAVAANGRSVWPIESSSASIPTEGNE
jgi:hypothetical protein